MYLAAMYFKVSMRTNPETGRYCGYYRLVESYRNQSDRVCHRTMLNVGYLDELTTDQLNLIQKILTAKVANHDNALFKLPYTDDKIVMHYVDEFYNRMVAEKRIDVLVEKKGKKASKNGKDLQMIDLTNTYFEGREQDSKLAKFGRSKEKRTDAKLIVLGLVINPEGFIKYSSILEGNMADSKTLEGMIGKLRIKTSFSAKKALVVIDAGIATHVSKPVCNK